MRVSSQNDSRKPASKTHTRQRGGGGGAGARGRCLGGPDLAGPVSWIGMGRLFNHRDGEGGQGLEGSSRPEVPGRLDHGADQTPSAFRALALSLVAVTPRLPIARYTRLTFTPASATFRAIAPSVPGLFWPPRSVRITSVSPSTLMPALSNAIRAPATSSTSTW